MADLKAIGRAVAIAKGHYPTSDGRHAVVQPGETFTVWEGRDKARWFTLLPPDAPATLTGLHHLEGQTVQILAAGAKVEPDTLAGAAKAERKRKAEVKPPTGDDIV